MLRYDEVSIEVLLNARHLFAFFIVVSDYSSSAAGSLPCGPRFGRLIRRRRLTRFLYCILAREYNSNQSRRFSNYYFPCLSSMRTFSEKLYQFQSQISASVLYLLLFVNSQMAKPVPTVTY